MAISIFQVRVKLVNLDYQTLVYARLSLAWRILHSPHDWNWES
jgi:hypothetical protein